MKPTVQEFLNCLTRVAPLDLAEDDDNCGLLVGRLNASVSCVLCALDITGEVCAEAADVGAELIVAHHPVIRNAVSSVTDTTPDGDIILTLAEQGISAICMHTNLDSADGGVNDELARLFIPNAKKLAGSRYLRSGLLPESLAMPEFAALSKDLLGCSVVRYYDSGRPVFHLAVGGGSCGDELKKAVGSGCDTLLTSDIKHSVFLEAAHYGVNLLDCGHFCTENVVIAPLANRLSMVFPNTRIFLSRRMGEPFTCL